MDNQTRTAQKKVLGAFSKTAQTFALAGGTALEMFYLRHRFSWDLDFFSPAYDLSEIERIVSAISRELGVKVKLESEFVSAGRAKVRFYTASLKKAARPLKIDFVEDVLIDKPAVNRRDGVRVYDVKEIYLHKIAAIAGTRADVNNVGRLVQEGRKEARDVYDVYRLSQTVQPLHTFLKGIPAPFHKGLIHWYRTYSRPDLKLGLLDLEIYDSQFDVKNLIDHLESEIKLFAKEMIEE